MSFLDKVKGYVAKREVPQYFLALNIGKDQVDAVIWGVVGGKTETLAASSKEYPNSQDLLLVAGQIIDQVGEQAQVDITKVVFGVPSDWVENDKIVLPHSEDLRKLAEDLDLDPLAFVSTIQAVVHLVSHYELSAPSAVFVETSRREITVSLVRNGKIEETKTASLADNFAPTLAELLADFKSEKPYPSRIIIFGSRDLGSFKDQIDAYNWTGKETELSQPEKPPIFLHTPKIDILAKGIGGKAIALAGATDLGYVKDRFSLEPEKIGKVEEPGEIKEKTEDFGFVYGRDILKEPARSEVVTEDKVSHLPPESTEEETGGVSELRGEEGLAIEKETISLSSAWLGWTEKISDLLSGRKGLVLLLFGLIILIFIVLFLAWWFVPKATVELEVNAQSLEKEAKITASPRFSTVNQERGEITAEILENTQKDSKKGVASGKKNVGEKAKGKVTVFNKTTAPRTFAAGTTIAGSSSLEFTFDDDVTVASRSATIEGITFGKTDVGVTAKTIGPDSNLAAGKDFAIADFDESLYAAHNDQPFSGGSSKEVTTVSDKDIEQLKTALLDDLFKKAKDEIGQKLKEDQKLIDGAIGKKVISQSADKDVDDEASVVNLTMEVDFKATVYKEGDLKEVLKGLVTNAVPEKLKLADGGIKTQTEVSQLADNGDLVLDAKLTADLVPKFDEGQIQGNLAGQSTEKAQEYLASIPEVVSAKITLSPPLPGPLKKMPKAAGNIKIVVAKK